MASFQKCILPHLRTTEEEDSLDVCQLYWLPLENCILQPWEFQSFEEQRNSFEVWIFIQKFLEWISCTKSKICFIFLSMSLILDCNSSFWFLSSLMTCSETGSNLLVLPWIRFLLKDKCSTFLVQLESKTQFVTVIHISKGFCVQRQNSSPSSTTSWHTKKLGKYSIFPPGASTGRKSLGAPLHISNSLQKEMHQLTLE